MTSTELRHHHFFAPGPKRILALEGGGVRGVISLAFLERMELLLRRRSGRPDLRLSDYFSLIGGTSTGAIIAAGLALGHSVGELIHLYLNISRASFVARTWMGFEWLGGRVIPKFNDQVLREAILEQFGPDTLGSDRLRCGLGIATKRLDTASVWLFHNHPDGPYFSGDPASGYTPNRDLPIANLLRASTAAPTFFGPEFIQVAPGVEGLFVDGAVSPHNNPALLLLMLATLRGYGFRWPMGEDRLMLVSVGTGAPMPRPLMGKSYEGSMAGIHAVNALFSMMYDANWLGQAMLQWMSASPTPWKIDSEVGDLSRDTLGPANLIHYLRYDAPLEAHWLERNLGLALDDKVLHNLQQIDHPENAPDLLELGRRAAEAQLRPEHFPAAFDLA